jgi:hypothetical protein
MWVIPLFGAVCPLRRGKANLPAAADQAAKVYWSFFSKKNKKNKHFFLKKEAKTFATLVRGGGGVAV